jgi:hypothetical protein
MKLYAIGQVYSVHSWRSAVEWSDWSASCCGWFIPAECSCGTLRIGGFLTLEKSKTLNLLGTEPRPSSLQPVAVHTELPSVSLRERLVIDSVILLKNCSVAWCNWVWTEFVVVPLYVWACLLRSKCLILFTPVRCWWPRSPFCFTVIQAVLWRVVCGGWLSSTVCKIWTALLM